jgi:hypothetical protein
VSERRIQPERVRDESILRASGLAGSSYAIQSLTYLAAASIDRRGSCKSLWMSKPYLRPVAGMNWHQSAGSFMRSLRLSRHRLHP